MIRSAMRLATLAIALATAPAMAGSQSSNSSSNCSNIHCSRIDRLVIEDGSGRRGWHREEYWRERPSPRRRMERHHGWDAPAERRFRLRRDRDED